MKENRCKKTKKKFEEGVSIIFILRLHSLGNINWQVRPF